MSKTYLGVYAMLLGALGQWLGVPLAEGDVEATVKVILAVGGGLLAMWGRYNVGGVNALGFRK